MQSGMTIKCPVCGRPNTNMERCTFCGTSLKEMAHPTPEQTGADPFGQAVPPRPQDPTKYPHTSFPSTPAPYPGTGPGPTTLPPQYAGFWIRAIAYGIDALIVQVLSAVILAVAGLGFMSGAGEARFEDLFSRIFEMNFNFLQVASVAVNLAYFTFFLGRSGQTPGKMLCRLKVVRTDGASITYSQALVRTIGYYINAFTLCLGFLWVAIDRRKQGLHDKIASTFVIRLEPASVRGWEPPIGKI